MYVVITADIRPVYIKKARLLLCPADTVKVSLLFGAKAAKRERNQITMNVLMYFWLFIGFILLIKGADFFVEASSSIAKALRIPSIIIGLTIVAFGTSAPELAVSTAAALTGENDIAIGNVIGSNIFNLLIVLGACGAINPFRVRLRWDFIGSIAVGVILLLLIAFDHNVSRMDGIILLILFAVFVGATIRDALVNRTLGGGDYELLSPVKCVVFIIGGLAAVILGGNLVVDNASKIAYSFGLSQNLIGLTIVAMGTSLPELVTSVMAARKGERGIALGNVIGSNIFNILMVLGLSATISPLTVQSQSVVDVACFVVFCLITLVLCRSKERISRPEGLFLIAIYFAYLVYIILR